MTFGEMKDQVMFQTGNDADDIEDFLPHVKDYINEGYDLLAKAWEKVHVGLSDYYAMEDDEDEPLTPEWTHRAICDWATWLVYRNGNPQRQQRGLYFKQSFEEVLAKIASEGGASGLNDDGSQKKFNKFINIPV